MVTPNPSQQQLLQQMVQQKNEQVANLFAERLNTELFPKEKLSDNWKFLTRAAILKTAPLSHRLSLSEFLNAVKVDPLKDDLTLFQFGVLSNSIEAVSPEQLGLTREDYGSFIQEALNHIEFYSKRVKIIRDEIHIEVEAELKMKNIAMGNNKLAKA